MISEKSVSCSKCQYAQNLWTDKNCQFCGASLSQKDFAIAAMLLGLAGLGIVGAGTFFLRDKFPVAPANQSLINGSIVPGRPLLDGSMISGQPLLRTTSSAQRVKKNEEASQSDAVQIYKRIADVPNVPQGIFNYGGSTTFAMLRSPAIIQTISQSFPQFQLRYAEPTMEQPGSGTGIQMLLQSQLSFAQSSRSLKDAELVESKARGYTLEEIPVAMDGIAFYVHPDLIRRGLKGLTLAQVQAIFTGKISNWKDIGGPDFEIVPFSRRLKSSATVDFLYESVLEHRPFGSNVKIVRNTTESIRRVAFRPGGIGYASTSEAINQQTIGLLGLTRKVGQSFVSPCGSADCTTVNVGAFIDGSYPITRRLLIIVKRDRKRDEQAGLAYANILLSDEGQQLINRSGLVSLR
jgi:phosphate transport system substrate-binding protein